MLTPGRQHSADSRDSWMLWQKEGDEQGSNGETHGVGGVLPQAVRGAPWRRWHSSWDQNDEKEPPAVHKR